MRDMYHCQFRVAILCALSISGVVMVSAMYSEDDTMATSTLDEDFTFTPPKSHHHHHQHHRTHNIHHNHHNTPRQHYHSHHHRPSAATTNNNVNNGNDNDGGVVDGRRRDSQNDDETSSHFHYHQQQQQQKHHHHPEANGKEVQEDEIMEMPHQNSDSDEKEQLHQEDMNCRLPDAWSGKWFQSGIPNPVLIDSKSIEGKGTCYEMMGDKFLFVEKLHLNINERTPELLGHAENYRTAAAAGTNPPPLKWKLSSS
ncbi:hypothetical protein Fcan01_24631 [Folsomia candida]|uniref:DUF7044 domain-containing protein n=1 Tax=Folsomia candida TaxID=158441 RepID=A0A226D5G8_FOLCA|nr:hypothetical protein Fcan01_24631 [Folsomia candida]